MSKKMDLEVKLEKLEEIVDSMDSNELNLDETIKSFESGLKDIASSKSFITSLYKSSSCSISLILSLRRVVTFRLVLCFVVCFVLCFLLVYVLAYIYI